MRQGEEAFSGHDKLWLIYHIIESALGCGGLCDPSMGSRLLQCNCGATASSRRINIADALICQWSDQAGGRRSQVVDGQCQWKCSSSATYALSLFQCVRPRGNALNVIGKVLISALPLLKYIVCRILADGWMEDESKLVHSSSLSICLASGHFCDGLKKQPSVGSRFHHK